MKKKFVSIIAICLVLVLSMPLTSFAYSSSDIKVHTRSSVSTSFEGTPLNIAIQNIFSFSGNAYGFNVSTVYDKLSLLPSSALAYDNYFLYIRNYELCLFCYNGSSFGCVTNNFHSSVLTADTQCNWYSYIPTSNGGYSYTLYKIDSSGTQWSGTGSNSAHSGSYYAFYSGGILISTNCELYYFEELTIESIPHNNVVDSNLYDHPEIYDQLTDLNNSNLPYVDGEGNVIDPTPVVEGNNNHMYFKDCEIGFCYPKSSPAPLSFGGAYFYIKYQVDDWVVNHISDYSLVFYADAEVGSDLSNTVRYEIALDPDGCITIPFSRVWINSLTSKGFSVLVTDQEVEDNFYKAYLYSLSPSGFVNFGSKAAASNQTTISGALSSLVSGGIDSFLYYINGDSIDLYSSLSDIANVITVKYNPYLITAFTLLTDGMDNSGLFEMQFDLVAGTEDVTDTSGLVNPEPFIPEDDPDYTPPSPSPGNSTVPGYNIVPSGYWQGTINGVIGYDPGYRDLKADVNRDPNGNFTQYLDPMKNDTFGSWFLSFVNDMPSEMKALLIAGTGVGIFFGLYRFIRRG